LFRVPVEIGPEPLGIERRGSREYLPCSVPGDEAVTLKRLELADRDAVAGHDEAFAGIECTHYLATLVAELPLG
jgi:hypothetical protein